MMLRLPHGVSWVEMSFPDEGHLQQRREAQHRAGRAAASAGLAALGCAGASIESNPRGVGAPVFPWGFAGSITHDQGRAAALVTSLTSGYSAVGADLHIVRPIDDLTARYIAAPVERQAAYRAVGPVADQLLFALKEATFKAASREAGYWYEFDDIELDFDATGRALLRRPTETRVRLCWALTGDVIRAAALIAA